VIYLYALTDRPGTSLPEGGLREITAHGVGGIFTDGDVETEPSPDALWAHEQIVEQLMRGRAVLPMRFGTRLAGEADLRDLLEARGREFARVLDGVRGRVELSVRVAGDDATPQGQPSSGAEYMRRRIDARRRSDQIAALVHRPLAHLAERSTSEPSPGRGFLMAGSYLIEEERVDRFTDRVHELQRAHPALALTCTGPWPPYSFVGDGGP
jgi:hypothetical protein